MDIIEAIKRSVITDTVIPKPAAKADFVVKGWGKRRGEEALIYYIPSHTHPHTPYQKGITVGEFRQAYDQLNRSGSLTRVWFNENMPKCAKEGGCNFTTIGGIFELLGIAKYSESGVYTKLGDASKNTV